MSSNYLGSQKSRAKLLMESAAGTGIYNIESMPINMTDVYVLSWAGAESHEGWVPSFLSFLVWSVCRLGTLSPVSTCVPHVPRFNLDWSVVMRIHSTYAGLGAVVRVPGGGRRTGFLDHHWDAWTLRQSF